MTAQTKAPIKAPIQPHIIKTTGEVEILAASPTFEEAQRIVGGYIEYVPLPRGVLIELIVNEEGLLLDLPYNSAASAILKDIWLTFHDPEDLNFSMMQLCGDVLVLPSKTLLPSEQD